MVGEDRPGIGDGGGELSDIRRRVIEHAVGVEGLNAGDDPAGYLDLVGPIETQQMRHDMLGMSGCALVRSGIERRAGIEHLLYKRPYVLQKAMNRLEVIARQRGAWRDASSLGKGLSPLPGDAAIVDYGGPHEHVFTILGVGVLANGLFKICSLDGGQKGRSKRPKDGAVYQQVKRFDRTWALTYGRDRVSTVASGAFDAVVQVPGDVVHPVRRVAAWIDLDVLFAGQ